MKAKKLLLLPLLALTGILSGCIKDDRSGCVDEDANLLLRFEYENLAGKDIFDDRIDMVDLIMFDRNRNFYAWIPVEEQKLKEFRGHRMNVEPGDYYIVCWANNESSRDEIPDDESGSLGVSYIHHSNSATADPLHYAPDKRFLSTDEETRTRVMEEGTWRLTVAPRGVTEDTMSFMSAHRTVHVYLKDFPGTTGINPVLPDVSIENLSEYYDFTLARGPETAYFVQTSGLITLNEQRYCYARFFIPHFDIDNNVNVVIKRDENAEPIYITMDEILRLHEVEEVFDGDDLVLDVEVNWIENGMYVEVAIPPYTVRDVIPKFD